MDRQTAYSGQILPETVLLQIAKDSMIGLAKLSAAVLGTSTMANGFAVTPTGPASLQVVCAPGEIYSLTTIDATQWSSLAADTTHSIMKQGILLDAVTLTCAAPGTTGQSINYLVQATYQDVDSAPVLLPYYNSANPALPYSGMGNNGLTQNTSRKGAAVVAVKAGASAATGSQTTPAPDAGYVGLYVVTVAFGQTTITSTSIAQYASAPLLPTGLLQSIQSGNTSSALDTGTANTYVCAFTPAITARSEQQVLRFKVKTSNNGACTVNDGLGSVALVGGAHSALQGGELVASGDAWVQWNTSIGGGSYILLLCTGAAEQVAPATQSQHAMQLVQAQAMFSPVIGSSRNLSMSVTVASATATITADEAIVETALGGQTYRLASINASINMGTTGIGGMDTGLAPVSGDVAIYLGYNATTGVSGLFAKDCTGAAAPEVYGGANRPSGFNAAALVAVWKTNASRQFNVGSLIPNTRHVDTADIALLNSTTPQGTAVALNIAPSVPFAAKTVNITCNISAATADVNFSASVSSTGSPSVLGIKQFLGVTRLAAIGSKTPLGIVQLLTPGQFYYTAAVGTGALSYLFSTTGYDF